MNNILLGFATFLYKNVYFLYRPLYFFFKNKKDRDELTLYKKYIAAGDIVLDIGANIGFTTNIFSNLVGDKGKIYSFEPDHVNFNHLREMVKNNCLNNVELINKAVSNNSNPLKIYTSNRLNVDHRTYKVDSYDEVYEIDAISIDQYLGNDQKVDFIKIDIQGYEMMAFEGMQNILKNNSNLIILSEFWPEGLREAGSSCTDFFNWLKVHNFNIYLIQQGVLKVFTEELLDIVNKHKGDRFENILLSKKQLL